jgi:hypothetical protein
MASGAVVAPVVSRALSARGAARGAVVGCVTVAGGLAAAAFGSMIGAGGADFAAP